MRYEDWGVNVDLAIDRALAVPVSIHCWQADDVRGLEPAKGGDGGGILATGSYPGAAKTGDQMRADFEAVLQWTPGVHRLNLHAIYAEPKASKERDELAPEDFQNWMDWGASNGLNLDFNPTYFAHPKADQGTLSAADDEARAYWIRHGIACRRIAAAFAKHQGETSVHNHWIPDGEKDSPADRWGPRERLKNSLDEILAEKLEGCADTVESKLFGLGSEDYVVGSYEFYSHYALTRDVGFCLDMGHFHPTETIADKISALLQFHPKLLVHASRPMRWDSDHVVVFNDDLRAVFREIERGSAWGRVWVALDFFDASIFRPLAYGVGLRATRKAILAAMLEPTEELKRLEAEGRRGEKLAVMDELASGPFHKAWSQLLEKAGRPGANWIQDANAYERKVFAEGR